MPNETPQKMLMVAVSLCLVCSVLVSSAAVLLKPLQERNKALDLKKNILAAAGLLEEGADVDQLFKAVEPTVVDLETGNYADGLDAKTFNARAAAKDPKEGVAIASEKDIAKIRRRAKYGLAYLVQGEKEGELRFIILPVHGKGLWSTMYGFIALKGDAQTVAGITFYQQGETAGLGAEVSNPVWNAKWRGKQIYGEEATPKIQVVKGTVDAKNPNADYQVDGIAGATLTSRGVTNLVRYWLGPDGYGPYLSRVREGQLTGIES